MLRYSARFTALKTLIDQGGVGEIRHIYARRNSNSRRAQRVLGRTDLAFWLTPHDVDIIMTDLAMAPLDGIDKGGSNKLRPFCAPSNASA